MDSFIRKKSIVTSWVSILVGYELNIISKEEIAEYAERYLNEHENCDYLISELILDKFECEDILRKIIRKQPDRIFNKNERLLNFEKRKWRLGLLIQA